MAVQLSALRASLTLPPQEYSWYPFVLETEKTRAIVQLEGLGTLKNPMTLGFEPMTWLAAQRFNQLRYCAGIQNK
jgi:hypothetical protein